MAREEAHGMSTAELEDRVWELTGKIQFALFTSWNGERMQQWPLTAYVEPKARTFYFLVDEGDGRYDHLEAHPDVVLGFADAPGKYVVVNGHAAISNDRQKIHDLWSPALKTWWDSADDPAIRLLAVSPDRAELWDSPGQIVAAAVMLTAAVTGGKPALGDHGTVRM